MSHFQSFKENKHKSVKEGRRKKNLTRKCTLIWICWMMSPLLFDRKFSKRGRFFFLLLLRVTVRLEIRIRNFYFCFLFDSSVFALFGLKNFKSLIFLFFYFVIFIIVSFFLLLLCAFLSFSLLILLMMPKHQTVRCA